MLHIELRTITEFFSKILQLIVALDLSLKCNDSQKAKSRGLFQLYIVQSVLWVTGSVTKQS